MVEVVNAKSYLDKSIAFMEHVENLSMAAVIRPLRLMQTFIVRQALHLKGYQLENAVVSVKKSLDYMTMKM